MNQDFLEFIKEVVKDFIKEKEYDRDMKLNISEKGIEEVAKKVINNESLWEKIEDIISWELRDYTFYEEEEK
jgi:hypothetical protein